MSAPRRNYSWRLDMEIIVSSLMGSVELMRGSGQLPPSGVVSLKDLLNRFRPDPSNSMRALLFKMFGTVSAKRPWAVILCRFKGSPPDPVLEEPIEQFYREAFAPGTGGLVEYWRDVSLGAIDITGSRVFGWVEIEIPRSSAAGSPKSSPPGPGRLGLANYAVNAVKRLSGEHALDGLFGSIAIYSQNFSKDGAPPGSDWGTDYWGQFWIDGGSTMGSTAISLTPPHDGDVTAHEMGHCFGMDHDVGADLNSDYEDPCCIMSQKGTFIHPTLLLPFGPAVCLPHLIQRDWMYKRRVYHDKGDWQSQPEGITLPLAPMCCPIARANLGIQLSYTQNEDSWDYYLEYILPVEWNRGVPGAPLFFVRRMAPKYGGTPAYLGYIVVPSVVGTTAEFVEPSGNVRFRIELTDLPGPMLSVSAKKM
jgi:hypothetical protein